MLPRHPYVRWYIVVFIILLWIISHPAVASPGSSFSGPHIASPDSSLTEKVRTQLNQLSDIEDDLIDIRINQGVVVLSGTVDNLLIRDRALAQIQRIQGVRSVVNNLTVKPTRADKLIEQDLKDILQLNPTTEKWKVWGEVRDNVIILDGIVSSWRARNYIVQLAKGIKGVRAIRNNIEIGRQSALSDEKLESEIEQYLKWDARIQIRPINVIVNDKKAILVGSAATAYQKELAVEKAHIPGISSVEADQLEVTPSKFTETTQSDSPQRPTPREKKKALRRAFDYDPRLPDDRKLQIDIRNNSVYLSGTVDNLIEKLAAGEIASQTAGIDTVENDLAIDREIHDAYPVPVTDRAILSRIREAIRRDTYLTSDQISVEVDNGVIRLNGAVNSPFKKIHAGTIASQVMGTVGIQNDLEVRTGT